jgi:hypothetical protein
LNKLLPLLAFSTLLLVPVGVQNAFSQSMITEVVNGGHSHDLEFGDSVQGPDILIPLSGAASGSSNCPANHVMVGMEVEFEHLFNRLVFNPICKELSIVEFLNSIIGGMFLEPDSSALFLAYGIANAFWIAPLAIGVGAGVYLTKSKLKKKV